MHVCMLVTVFYSSCSVIKCEHMMDGQSKLWTMDSLNFYTCFVTCTLHFLLPFASFSLLLSLYSMTRINIIMTQPCSVALNCTHQSTCLQLGGGGGGGTNGWQPGGCLGACSPRRYNLAVPQYTHNTSMARFSRRLLHNYLGVHISLGLVVVTSHSECL